MRRTRGWLGFVNDIPLTWKFALIYLLCVLLPILSINVLFFQQISENVRTREESNLQMTLERASKKTMDLILGGVALSHSIATDRTIYEELDRVYEDPVSFYDNASKGLGNKLKPFLSAYPYVENISIYTENGSIVSGGNYFVLDEAAKSSPWYRMAAESSSSVNLMMYVDPDPLITGARKVYFSILRKLSEYPMYGDYAKYLKIDIKTSTVDEILSQEQRYLSLSVADGQGKVLFPSSAFLTDSTVPPSGGSAGKTLQAPLGSASYIEGWKMIGTANAALFKDTSERVMRFFWELAAVSTLVPTWLIFIIWRSYNYRIKRLSRHMDRAKNEKFDLIPLTKDKDEIGGLIRSFNRMAATIESLINDVYKLEIEQKDMQLEQTRAELKLLQSQVNPHFLFNTLNALLVVSAKNGYAEVTDIIKNLSLLLRRMLSWSDEAVSLQDELDFTEKYLKIEKFRFGDRFDYTFEVAEEALRCMVPKMCVQPLVENACKHGLQSVKGQRNIRIEASASESYLQISVEDNGIGIEPERLAFIRGQLNAKLDTDENVGLRNVYRRLRLHYGERVDLFIDSELDQGTRISFRIPAKPSDEKEGPGHVLGTAG
ncbi:sensor histidine kinase [Cohnella caldifontis]|uniref:sensor histidine kinase n=1 Tax=Cohnella caldifontis TaxID=3027471 RepID=UPI0023EDE385|nr:sensor histidine kinase [Cohnella sp. YIM B05605]